MYDTRSTFNIDNHGVLGWEFLLTFYAYNFILFNLLHEAHSTLKKSNQMKQKTKYSIIKKKLQTKSVPKTECVHSSPVDC